MVFAAADTPQLNGTELLNHRISAVMTDGGVMLFIALLITLCFVMPSAARNRESAGTRPLNVGLEANRS